MNLLPAFADIGGWSYFLNGTLIFLSLLLMFVILIQKGKGGGLAGAFGGAGGSSAFGSKAGDLFTKITLWFAAFWVLIIMINVKTMQQGTPSPLPDGQIQQSGDQGQP
jgi:preprotein translocase subunit SecG